MYCSVSGHSLQKAFGNPSVLWVKKALPLELSFMNQEHASVKWAPDWQSLGGG
jgi:hypothetical protein